MKLVAKTLAGLEELLEKELISLGAKKTKIVVRAVEFEGDDECLYRAMYECRLAVTILRPIWNFTAIDEHTAYRKAYACDWSRYFSVDQTFSISAAVHSDFFTHSQYISLKLKDAICDRFRKDYGRRPNVDTTDPDVRLNLRIYKDAFSISLDAAGAPLFKREYRREGHVAPLNEVLGAGMVQLSGWTPDQILHDGMCGTGTILLEAAMLAKNIPAQTLRRSFAFHRWPNFDRKLWHDVTEAAKGRIKDVELTLRGTDMMRSAVMAATRSGNLLGLSDELDVRKGDFFDFESPEPVVLIMNPPYGERMGDKIEELYGDIGTHLKHQWIGSTAWLLSSNKEALKRVGLKPSKKITLFNGPLECQFCKFEMYAGSKKRVKS